MAKVCDRMEQGTYSETAAKSVRGAGRLSSRTARRTSSDNRSFCLSYAADMVANQPLAQRPRPPQHTERPRNGTAGPPGLPALEKVRTVTLRPETPLSIKLATWPSEQGWGAGVGRWLAPALPRCSFTPAGGSRAPRLVAMDQGCGADGGPL